MRRTIAVVHSKLDGPEDHLTCRDVCGHVDLVFGEKEEENQTQDKMDTSLPFSPPFTKCQLWRAVQQQAFDQSEKPCAKKKEDFESTNYFDSVCVCGKWERARARVCMCECVQKFFCHIEN